MAENTPKKPIKEKKGRKRSNISLLNTINRIDSLVENGIPTNYIPHLVFLAVLGIFYIGNSHYAESMIRQTNKLESQVENLRSNYTSRKVEFMYSSKQSEIIKAVEEKQLRLKESNKNLYKIKLKKNQEENTEK
ncbi:FtsL-like putative cell division protein [Microscilla marina]|uniref:Cell division protein FtsL n=1 Tax=Microscilla marina ATCC 23134 TaxID=313606 RepID=A1ZKQ4_MICM2|nr:FtsL-like putative cell division protein [Microscilla marina]EAY28870.1 hypothetical protein M23134_00023 [Microscilla marina ATCC 23134]